jgi:uncharacterized glyoxalase superfamily protein PhnB
MPDSTVIPVLHYADVDEAVAWLQAAFAFQRRLRIGNHRAQLIFEDGAVVVAKGNDKPAGHSIMVRVTDANAHHERSASQGANIIEPPTDYPYGERQYTAVDIGGHVWTFSQTIADSDPASWGGQAGDQN